jgi:hypothetical protein
VFALGLIDVGLRQLLGLDLVLLGDAQQVVEEGDMEIGRLLMPPYQTTALAWSASPQRPVSSPETLLEMTRKPLSTVMPSLA